MLIVTSLGFKNRKKKAPLSGRFYFIRRSCGVENAAASPDTRNFC